MNFKSKFAIVAVFNIVISFECLIPHMVINSELIVDHNSLSEKTSIEFGK